MTANRVWQCGECRATYEFEDDARECCQPGVYKSYLCPRCGSDFHVIEVNAKSCCQQEAKPSPDDLEPVGQIEADIMLARKNSLLHASLTTLNALPNTHITALNMNTYQLAAKIEENLRDQTHTVEHHQSHPIP